jgi:hypothetical protein
MAAGILGKVELLKDIVHSGAKDVLVVRREATHHVQGLCLEKSDRLGRLQRLSQIPQLAGVVEGGRRKDVG